MKFFRQSTYYMPISICAFAVLSLLVAVYGTVVCISRNEDSALLFTWLVCGSICFFCLISAYVVARQGLYVSKGTIYYRRICTKPFSYDDITAIVIIPKAYHSRSGYEISYKKVKAGRYTKRVRVYAVFLMKNLYKSEINPEIFCMNSLSFYSEYRKNVLGQALYHPDLIHMVLSKKSKVDVVECS